MQSLAPSAEAIPKCAAIAVAVFLCLHVSTVNITQSLAYQNKAQSQGGIEPMKKNGPALAVDLNQDSGIASCAICGFINALDVDGETIQTTRRWEHIAAGTQQTSRMILIIKCSGRTGTKSWLSSASADRNKRNNEQKYKQTFAQSSRVPL